MEKLDKEALAQQYANDSEESGLSRYDYKQGLEYAENHYLPLIWERDAIIKARNEVLGYRNDDINRLIKKLQIAEKLLEEVYENPNKTEKIRKFLKK